MYMLLACIKNVHPCIFESRRGHRTMKLKLYAIAGSHMGTGYWTLQEQLVLLISEPSPTPTLKFLCQHVMQKCKSKEVAEWAE